MLPIRVKSRKDTPTYLEWGKIVQKALAEIEQKKLQKVVLARKTTFEMEGRICPWELLKQIQAKNATLFSFVTEKEAFLGATPEVLYKREKNQISTMAIAATALDPIKLEEEKEVREFAWVADFMEGELQKICTSVKREEPVIVHTGSLYHRKASFSGVLKEGVSDAEILATLHPTPAIGGFPRKEALAFIAEHEPFSRDLYASPFGYMTREKAEFVIAIRSCLIEQNTLHLFAGAGIVEGSDPKKEWEELEHKISQFTRLFEC